MPSVPSPRSLLTGLLALILICVVTAEKKDDSKGKWGEWSEPSPCSVSCGSGQVVYTALWKPGTKEQSREKPFYKYKSYPCLNPDIPHCPVDGSWSGWTRWAECTKVCGGGTRGRYRKCYGVMHNGKQCEGDKTEDEDCSREPCPALPRNFDMTVCTKEGNFTCTSKKMCIPKDGRCNVTVQCHDGSDEIKCPKRGPGLGRIRYDLGNGATSTTGYNLSSLMLFSTISLLLTTWSGSKISLSLITQR